MKLRITKLSEGYEYGCYWYKDYIGKEVEIVALNNKTYEPNSEDDWDVGNFDPSYIVRHPTDNSLCIVLHQDGEVVFEEATNKYKREVKPGVFVDVYDVIRAFAVTDPCLQHAIKKLLAAGERGHKNRLEDLEDIVASTKRAIEIHKEWNK